MPYYEHEGKVHTLDALCELGVIKAIRLYRLGEQCEPTYFADSEDLAGWPISENVAIYLAGKYFDKNIEVM